MSKKATVILPQTQQILNQMGEQLRLAPLRRHLSTELVAERAERLGGRSFLAIAISS